MSSPVRPEAVLALIPARGGSKGIPGKNLRPLGGKPLLAHTLDQALSAPRIGRVVVSTDDETIARVARDYGAEVVHRPADLSGDEASSESALLHALEALREADGYEPELVVFLQATSPLRPAGAIDEAIDLLEAEGADSLFSACPVEGFVWRTAPGQSEPQPLTYDPSARPRRQEVGTDLLENGSIYVFRPWVLRDLGNRLGGKVTVVSMDPLDSYQVDEPEDLDFMERLLTLRPDRRILTSADLAEVQLVVFDFDGVFTDNRVWVSQDGTEAVAANRSDGLGLETLRRSGIGTLVLSKERNPVVAARCRKLGIECLQGQDDKLPQLQRLAAERGLDRTQVAYVGNDVNDLECLAWAGVGIGVADSVLEVRASVDRLTAARGGHGAVREVCDRRLEAGIGEEKA